MVLPIVLRLLFPTKHLLLGWNLRVKNLITLCVLAFCISGIGLLSPRVIREDWRFEKLVTLRCIVFPRACCLLGALCTLDGWRCREDFACEASARVWEPPIELWVCAPRRRCKGLRNPPRRILIVEGEPIPWVRFIGE